MSPLRALAAHAFLLTLAAAQPAGFDQARITAWLGDLRASEWALREGAALALSELGAEHLPRLGREHARARRAGIGGLQSLLGASRLRIALRSRSAFAPLFAELGHPEANVSVTAMRGLILAPLSWEQRRQLVVALPHAPPAVQQKLLGVLGSRGERFPELLATACRLATTAEAPRVRWRAQWYLALVSPRHPEASAAFRHGVADDRRSVAETALWGLERAGAIAAADLARVRNPQRWPEASARLARAGAAALLTAIETAPRQPLERRAWLVRAASQRAGHPGVRAFLHAELSRAPDDETADVWREALFALPRLELGPRRTLDALEEALASPADEVRGAAAQALANLERTPRLRGLLPLLAPDLVAAWRREWVLGSPRRVLFRVLLGCAEARRSALPYALRALRDGGPTEIAEARLLLRAEGGAARGAWQEALAECPKPERGTLLQLAGEMGSALPAEVLEAARGPSGPAAAAATAALIAVRASAPAALAIVRERIADAPSLLAEGLARSAASLGPYAALGASVLERELPARERARLLLALAPFGGPKLRAACHRHALEHPAFVVREAALRALVSMGTTAEDDPVLAGVFARRGRAADTPASRGAPLASGERLVLEAALEALGERPDPPASLVRAAARLAGQPTLRRPLVRMLERLGPAARPAAHTLGALFNQDRDPGLATLALRASARLAPAPPDLSTSLGVAVARNQGSHQFHAAAALAAAPGRDRLALPYLLAALTLVDRDAPRWERIAPGAGDRFAGVPLGFRVRTGPDYVAARPLLERAIGELLRAHPSDAELARVVLRRAAAHPEPLIAAGARRLLSALPPR